MNIIETRPSKSCDVKDLSDKFGQIPRYPAYGKLLAERLRWHNPPTLVFIEVGGDYDWQRAKNWQRHPDFASLVLLQDLEPKRLTWPVSGCPCLIEWALAAPEELIIKLVICLLRSGALFVTIVPLFVDFSTPSHYFDTENQRWIQTRETVKKYYPKEVRHVAR